MPNLHDMTVSEREKLIQDTLTQSLDSFRKGGVPAETVMMAIDAYVNIRLGEAIRMINEALEKALPPKIDDTDPRKIYQ
jgi:hypothetical protein